MKEHGEDTTEWIVKTWIFAYEMSQAFIFACNVELPTHLQGTVFVGMKKTTEPNLFSRQILLMISFDEL